MTLSLVVRLALLAAAPQGAFADSPVSQIQVRGLTDSAGAKVILINARHGGGGEHSCRDSSVVPLDEAGASDVEPLSLFKGRQARKTFILDIARRVEAGCWCEDDKAGLAVLAPGKAIAYIANNKREKQPRRLCTHPEGGLTVDLRARREVSVQVWAAKRGAIPSMARDDIANADWIYNKSLAGITLRPVFREVKEDDLKTALSACFPKPDEKKCCATVADSDFFEPGAINVYYGIGSGNFSCDKGTPAASFIHDLPILGDAAHEMSHLLGLFEKDPPPAAKHATGHITDDTKNFGCENVMWTKTHFLKDELTLGQAFWISLSNLSFLGKSGANLACADDATPCPRFSLRETETFKSRCEANEVSKDNVAIWAQDAERVSCDPPSSTYENARKLEDALNARYDQLKRHVRGRDDLRLGAVIKGEFLDHWTGEFALNVTALSALEKSGKSRKETEKERNRILETAVPRHFRRGFHVEEHLEEVRRNLAQACKASAPAPN